MVERVKLELGFQDMYVPTHTAFGAAQDGPVVLYGMHARRKGFLSMPYLMGRDGVFVCYVPKAAPGMADLRKRLADVPEKSLIWIGGELKSGLLRALDGGSAEEFPHPEASKRLDQEFKSYLDPDVFEYLSRNWSGVCFLTKGKVKVESDGEVTILNKNGDTAAFLLDEEDKLAPYDGRTVRFNSLVTYGSMRFKEKGIYPDLGKKAGINFSISLKH